MGKENEKLIIAVVESCGDKKHKKGCYIRFNKFNKKSYWTSDDSALITDFDKRGNIIGIENYDGFKFKDLIEVKEIFPVTLNVIIKALGKGKRVFITE